jgi:hypothetical protein
LSEIAGHTVVYKAVCGAASFRRNSRFRDGKLICGPDFVSNSYPEAYLKKSINYDLLYTFAAPDSGQGKVIRLLLRKISPNFSLVCDKVKKGFENSVSLA